MHITQQNIERDCIEPEIIDDLRSLDNKHIIELVCGKADLTRLMAGSGTGRRFTAYEIDEIQHQEEGRGNPQQDALESGQRPRLSGSGNIDKKLSSQPHHAKANKPKIAILGYARNERDHRP